MEFILPLEAAQFEQIKKAAKTGDTIAKFILFNMARADISRGEFRRAILLIPAKITKRKKVKETLWITKQQKALSRTIYRVRS